VLIQILSRDQASRLKYHAHHANFNNHYASRNQNLHQFFFDDFSSSSLIAS
jgi:hypothetical protein